MTAARLDRVRDVIALHTGAANVEPRQDLFDDLEVDSVSIVAIVQDLEEAFDVRISDDEMVALATVEDCELLIERKLAAATPEPMPEYRADSPWTGTRLSPTEH